MHRLICDNEHVIETKEGVVSDKGKCNNFGKEVEIKREDYNKALLLEFFCKKCGNCLKLQKFNDAKGWWEYVDRTQKGFMKSDPDLWPSKREIEKVSKFLK